MLVSIVCLSAYEWHNMQAWAYVLICNGLHGYQGLYIVLRSLLWLLSYSHTMTDSNGDFVIYL